MVRARGTSWQLSRDRACVGSHPLSRNRPQTHCESRARDPLFGFAWFFLFS